MPSYTCDKCSTEHTLEKDPTQLANPQLYLVEHLDQSGCEDCPANIETKWFDDH